MKAGDMLSELGPPVTAVTRQLVPFVGEGCGVERLSWGQQDLFDAMQRQQSWLPLGAVMPLAPGTTLDGAEADLRFLVSRNQTMRTRLRFGADGERQVVSGTGEFALDVVDVLDCGDPAVVADDVATAYQESDYDFTTEWPVRMAVVRHKGVLTHRVTVVCHLVTDGHGARLMWADLASRDPVTGEASTPPAPMQPMEQARWQRTEAGERHCQAALRHWDRLLRTVPARRFPDQVDRGSPRHWQGRFRSPALQLAIRSITARTEVDSASVLLALYAIAVGRLTGINPVVARVLVGNRFRPGLDRAVSPITQPGLCVLDLAGITIDEAARLARRTAFVAYKYAYYDMRRMEELIARVGRERGEQIDLTCYLNDRRFGRTDGMLGPPPAPEQLRAAVPRSTFEWERKEDEPFERLFLHVNYAPDEADFTICADTHYLSPAEMQACVRKMESAAVAAALDPATATGVPEPALSAGGG
jgi:hypothetical protein